MPSTSLQESQPVRQKALTGTPGPKHPTLPALGYSRRCAEGYAPGTRTPAGRLREVYCGGGGARLDTSPLHCTPSARLVENELFLPNAAPSSITVNCRPIWKVSSAPPPTKRDQSYKTVTAASLPKWIIINANIKTSSLFRGIYSGLCPTFQLPHSILSTML